MLSETFKGKWEKKCARSIGFLVCLFWSAPAKASSYRACEFGAQVLKIKGPWGKYGKYKRDAVWVQVKILNKQKAAGFDDMLYELGEAAGNAEKGVFLHAALAQSKAIKVGSRLLARYEYITGQDRGRR